MKFECISGKADNNNINVIVMQGDIVELVEVNEGSVVVKGVAGFCKGRELTFTPNAFSHCFKVIGLTYTL